MVQQVQVELEMVEYMSWLHIIDIDFFPYTLLDHLSIEKTISKDGICKGFPG